MSTSFHLQTNGQMERTNKEVTKYLCMFCNEEQDDWVKILPIMEFAYNSHVHSASGSSPFKLLYSYQPTWSTPAGGQVQMPSVSDCLYRLSKAHREASAVLRKSKEAMREASEGLETKFGLTRTNLAFKPRVLSLLINESVHLKSSH
jgi:hypothetical protein